MVNLCHTIGWLIQCVKELADKVEGLSRKVEELEERMRGGR